MEEKKEGGRKTGGSWFSTKEQRAKLNELKILAQVDAEFTSRMVPCGKSHDGKLLQMNTLIFEPNTLPGQENIPLVVAHGYGAGVGFFFRNFDSLASIPGTQLYAIDWIGMGRSTRVAFPKVTEEEKKKKKSLKKSTKDTRESEQKQSQSHHHQSQNKKSAFSVESSTLQRERHSSEVTQPNPEYDQGQKKIVETSEDFFLNPFEAWRKEMKIEKVILVGHSLGGYLSTVYAMKYPERLHKLILLSPVGIPDPPRSWEEDFDRKAKENWKLRTAKWLWESSTPQQVLRNADWLGMGKWLAHRMISRRFEHLDLDQNSIDAISGYLHSISILPRSGEDSLNTILKFGAWARMPLKNRIEAGLKVPTAFIYGEIDWMSPTTALLWLQRRHMPEVIKSCHIVSAAGHHMYLENPFEFNGIIREEIFEALNLKEETS